MIRVVAPPGGLTPAERYGLDTLLDLSRLLPVDDPAAAVVELTLTPNAVGPDDVATARWQIERGDGTVRLPRALLPAITAIAGAGVEQGSAARDRHGRVPAEENLLARAGTERRPVVSELARALRDATRAVAGRRPVRCLVPWPGGRRWAAAFTHDLDVVAGWPAFTGLRCLELLRRGQGIRAVRVAAAVAGSLGGSPVWDGVRQVLEVERAHGVRSTWFILSGTPSLTRWRQGDVTYAVESPLARRILGAARGAGHELGLHGSFETAGGTAAFVEERRRLEAAGAGTPEGVRQHFLKMRPGATQRAMREAGFGYDATYGFSDRNGFRLGVADIVAGWDAPSQSTTLLDEVPLHWMDRAQSKYQGVEDPDAWTADGLELAGRCRDVEGLWVGLWHPNLTAPLGFPDAPPAYAGLVRAVATDPNPPALLPLGELVEWRRARRAARAARVTEGGGVEWSGREAPLEDGEGRSQ